MSTNEHLTLLLSRVAESKPNQETFLRDLQMLITFIRDLRNVLDSRTFRRKFEVDGQECPQTVRTTDHTGASGRPRYAITESQIRMLRQEGFRLADIARYFGVSPILIHYAEEEENMNCLLMKILIAFQMMNWIPSLSVYFKIHPKQVSI